MAQMWHLAARLGGVTLARPLSISSVLTSGLAAPALLRATSVTLPSLALQQRASRPDPFAFRSPSRSWLEEKTDLEKYLLLAQEPMNTDVLTWWKLRDHSKPADPSSGRPEGLPHLARMARQWLGCPATSAGVERLFSKAGSMHHDLKGSMEDGSLEHSLIANANTE